MTGFLCSDAIPRKGAMVWQRVSCYFGKGWTNSSDEETKQISWHSSAGKWQPVKPELIKPILGTEIAPNAFPNVTQITKWNKQDEQACWDHKWEPSTFTSFPSSWCAQSIKNVVWEAVYPFPHHLSTSKTLQCLIIDDICNNGLAMFV